MPLLVIIMTSVEKRWIMASVEKWTMSNICIGSSRIAQGLGRRGAEAEVGGRDEATRVQGGTESWHGW